jgi:hypothetical protein
MSNKRTYSQAIEEMTADPERRYSFEGNTYRVLDGNLEYFRPDTTRWFRSACSARQQADPWYRLLSDIEREESFRKSAMQTALNDSDPTLNICSKETPPAPKNPNPKKAFGATKPDLALIPPVGQLHMASALEVGDAKYGAYNWRKDPVEAMTYLAAAQRHLANYLDGERISSDGVHNLGQVMACCAIVLDSEALGILIDNRPPPGKSSQVQDELQAQKKAKLALVKKAV